MAIEAQGQGQVQEIISVIKRRSLQVVLPGVLGVAIAGAVSVLLPVEYSVMTRVELREMVLPIGGFGASSQTIRRDIASAGFHITSVGRVRRVIEKLEWQDYTALTGAEQYDYVRRVAEAVRVQVSGGSKNVGSSFITIRYSDSDGQRAEHFLNRLRDSYTAEVVERFRNTARDARDTLHNQLSIAHQRHLDQLQRSSELKKRYGLSPTQRGATGQGPINEDPVFLRLASARSELMSVVQLLTRAKSSKEALEKRYNEAPREVPETSLTGGVSYDQLLQSYEAEITGHIDGQDGLRPEHSIYKKHEAEILKLRDRIEQVQEQAFSLNGDDVRMVLNPQRAIWAGRIAELEDEITGLEAEYQSLRTQIDELAQKSSELTDVYREVSQLEVEVDNSRERYGTAKRLYERQTAFVEFIAQPHANPFTVAEVARSLEEPSSPQEGLMVVIGLILGLGVGVLTAIAAEYGRNAFRSPTDLSRVLTVPVLGAVNRIVTGRESRAIFARRAMVVTSTLILAGVIFWVTWAYEEQPRLLGHQLTHFIDGLRMELR